MRGRGSGAVFYHEGRDISALVHGDDFVFVAEDGELDWIQDLVVGWFEVNVRGRMGKDKEDCKEMVILRTVRWTEEEYEYEADRRHRERLLDKFVFGENTRAAVSN